MLQLAADSKCFWFQGTADFRKGFNGLCGLLKEYLQTDVINGGVFIFLNHRLNAIKLLKWQGDGLAIYHKRLEQGVFVYPKMSKDGRMPSQASIGLFEDSPTSKVCVYVFSFQCLFKKLLGEINFLISFSNY